MAFEDYMILREGWLDKMLHDQALARKQTFIIAASLGQKMAALESAWPDPYKPVPTKRMVMYKGQQMTEHMMKRLIKAKEDGVKRKKEKQKTDPGG